MRQVELTQSELRWVRATVAELGVRATALHLCTSRIVIRAIVEGRTTVYRQSAESIRARLVADMPSREEVDRVAAARHQAAQQARWRRKGAREAARAKAVAQWSDLDARRRMSEIKLAGLPEDELQRARQKRERVLARKRLELIRERAARVIGCANGTTQSARAAAHANR